MFSSFSCYQLEKAEMSNEVLTGEILENLQQEANQVAMGDYLSQLWNNQPFLSPFDKHVLQIKPNDCPIVSKFNQIETFKVNGFEKVDEVSLSTFWAPHPLREFHKRSIKSLESNDDIAGLKNAKDQLDKIDSLPLIVFIHGLGGQMSQFEPLLQEFRNCSDIFSFDLPGFGNSKRPSRNDELNDVFYSSLSNFEREDLDKIEWTLSNLTWSDFSTNNIVDLIYQILEQKFSQRNFIFISHSMGTHITLRLLNKFENERVESIILMTPPKLSLDGESLFDRIPFFSRTFLNTCTFTPKLFDWYRLLDRRGGFNSNSVKSFLSINDESGGGKFKKLTQYRWNLDTDSEIFLKYLKGFVPVGELEFIKAVKAIKSDEKYRILIIGAKDDKVTPISSCEQLVKILVREEIKYKFEIIEHANHSLFLDTPNILSGIVYDFVEELKLNISCTWVLQVKAMLSGDKWGLKNKVKWDKVVTLSEPLINKKAPLKPKCYLLGMKTLRQSDPIHNPHDFEINHPDIFGVIDIGSDTPAYDPDEFERIQYVKFKTESKVIPDNVTIVKFINIVEKLMEERITKEQFIVIHCHYGQNRTGFLICCYLIEKLGWLPSEAISSFEYSKPPGIKHVHFKNALYLRYR